MQGIAAIALLFFSFFSASLFAQDKKYSPQDYIEKYKDLAIIEMKRTGIPASITLAQGMLESSNGNSRLAREANNHFGVKCKKEWQGGTMLLDDDKPQECFRVYQKVEESYYDHSEFITTAKRYSFLFKLDPRDYKGWANGLKEAGYATNPHYPELLISSIEEFNLNQYDVERLPDSSGKATRVIDSMKDFEFNGLPACIVKYGDSVESIAKEHHLHPSVLRKYNDLADWDKPEPGTLLYLKQKPKTGTQEYYVVHNGEGMYMISQLFRIQLKQLYKKNRMECGMQPKPGEKIFLQAKRDTAPTVLPAGTIVTRRKEGINLKKPIPPGDTLFRADIILYRKVHLPEYDTTLPKRLDSTLSHIDKSINESSSKPRVHFDTLAKLPANYKTPDDTFKITNIALADTGHMVVLPPVKKDSVLKIEQKVIEPEIKQNPVKDSAVVIQQKIPEKKIVENQITEKKKDSVPPGIHIVQKGETLFSISKKYKISVDSLKSWNHLETNEVKLGRKLHIRPRKTTHKVAVKAEATIKTHTVQKGETLFSIAKQYSMKVDELKSMNNLTGNALKLGQVLQVK